MTGKFEAQRTRYGGVRRSNAGSSNAQSGSQMKSASVARNHPRVQLKWRERLGLPECPYVIRWRLETPWFSIRLHHWLNSDDDRAFHDHPWDFTTIVLKGGYTDFSPSLTLAGNLGTTVLAQHLQAPTIARRRAEHRHTVVPDPGGAWTIIVTGPRRRTWGFWAAGVKFIKANKWFASRGHHPCDD